MEKPKTATVTEPRYALTWWHAVLGYIVSLIGAMVMTVIIAASVPMTEGVDVAKGATDLSVKILWLQYLVLFVGGVIVARAWQKKRYHREDIGFVLTKGWLPYAYAAVVAVGFVLISMIAARLLPGIAEAGQKVTQQVGMGESTLRDMMMIISATIAAPLGEEMVYRGLIFKGIYDEMKRRKIAESIAFAVPAIFSGLLFAISHGGEGQDKQVFFLTLFGVMMAWLYIKTKSFYVPVVSHSIVNVINFTMMAISAKTPVSPTVYIVLFIAPFVCMGTIWLTERVIRVREQKVSA